MSEDTTSAFATVALTWRNGGVLRRFYAFCTIVEYKYLVKYAHRHAMRRAGIETKNYVIKTAERLQRNWAIG